MPGRRICMIVHSHSRSIIGIAIPELTQLIQKHLRLTADQALLLLFCC